MPPTFTIQRSGIKSFDEPLMYRWWVIPASEVDTFVYDFGEEWKEEVLAVLGAQIPELNPFGYYRGPGQAFSSPPTVWRSRTRVLITQREGLDV